MDRGDVDLKVEAEGGWMVVRAFCLLRLMGICSSRRMFVDRVYRR